MVCEGVLYIWKNDEGQYFIGGLPGEPVRGGDAVQAISELARRLSSQALTSRTKMDIEYDEGRSLELRHDERGLLESVVSLYNLSAERNRRVEINISEIVPEVRIKNEGGKRVSVKD